MLVLTRRVGESIMIGDDIVVTIVEMRGDVARVGIAAPRHVRVHREEVYREVAGANESAAQATDSDAARLAALVAAGRQLTTSPKAATTTSDRPTPPQGVAAIPKPPSGAGKTARAPQPAPPPAKAEQPPKPSAVAVPKPSRNPAKK